MTYSEELVIINKRIPEQEKYITGLKLEYTKAGDLVWKDAHEGIRLKLRYKELILSAEGVLENLKTRKADLYGRLHRGGHGI